MDLLDGSDVEEGDVDLEEENALLGSDDEENYSHGGVGVEYEYDDEEHILHNEDSDVLELELNDEDGLEFEEEHEISGRRNVAPVQVRPSAIPHHQNKNHSNYVGVQHSTSDVHYQHQNSYETPSGPGSKTEVDGEDDDDEDDDRNTRSRFQSERNTQDINFTATSASASTPFGNPIQTLGGRPVLTGDPQRQKQWGNGRPHPHPNSSGQRQFVRPQSQRFPHHRQTLLGEGPRPGPGFNQFRHRPPLNGAANVQFQERIFTDFNRPMRKPNPQQLAIVQGQRAMPPGPRHQGNMNNGPRPGNHMTGPPRPRQLNPPFLQGNNNRHIRPRNQNPGYPNQRPPHQWRNQRPQRHPFPGMPNHPPNPMPNMPPMAPMQGRPPFHQDQMQRPPLFGHGMRPEMHSHQQPNVPFHNLPGQNPVQASQFGPTPIISQQYRMPMGPPEPIPPVQPVQPFYHAQQQQQQQPFVQELHNPQGFWPPQNNDNHGWGGQPVSHNPQNFLVTVPAPQAGAGFQIPIDSAMPNQPHQFVESQPSQQGRPLPAYDQLQNQPAYYEHQRHEYEYQQERHFEQDSRSQMRVPEILSRRETYEDRIEYRHPRQDRSPPPKRKYEDEDKYYRGSPEKRLNGRLGPPVKHEPPPRDVKAEEQLKIREETRKTMGLDDDYIKKLDEQKRLREQILRKKAEARRKINTTSSEIDEENYSKKIENELLKTEAVTSSFASRPSIYINPKAFRGDLSALNSNLKNINVHSGGIGKQQVSGGTPSSSSPSKVSVKDKNDGSPGTVPVKSKSKTILRIVKDKFGNEISRSKVIVRPKQQPSSSTKAS